MLRAPWRNEEKTVPRVGAGVKMVFIGVVFPRDRRGVVGEWARTQIQPLCSGGDITFAECQFLCAPIIWRRSLCPRKTAHLKGEHPDKYCVWNMILGVLLAIGLTHLCVSWRLSVSMGEMETRSPILASVVPPFSTLSACCNFIPFGNLGQLDTWLV